MLRERPGRVKLPAGMEFRNPGRTMGFPEAKGLPAARIGDGSTATVYRTVLHGPAAYVA